MRTTCLINSYNYADYLPAAVDSALSQTVPFDEIIVVDDGSTDGSPELLAARYGALPQVRIVTQANAGQLSCFNEGFRRATGEVVFFLDADDRYAPNYAAEVLQVYVRRPVVDCVFTALRRFGQIEDVQLPYPADRDFGYSAVLTAFGWEEWVGAPTSCLSFRASLLQRFLPIPLEHEWRTRTDDCLLFGCAAAGGHKFYLAEPLVHYRVHGQNHFYGKPFDAAYDYQRRLTLNRLFGWFQSHLHYDLARLPLAAEYEFALDPQPTAKRLRQYWRILGQSRLRWGAKWRIGKRMFFHYWRHRSAAVVGPRSAGGVRAGRDFPIVPSRPAALRDSAGRRGLTGFVACHGCVSRVAVGETGRSAHGRYRRGTRPPGTDESAGQRPRQVSHQRRSLGRWMNVPGWPRGSLRSLLPVTRK